MPKAAPSALPIDMKNTERAFHWIIGILKNCQIPFQITGGFAARLYGVDRELRDIDFDIPLNKFMALTEAVKEYVTFGPAQYVDNDWDLFLLSLTYEGQDMDFGALEAKFFDRSKQSWATISADLFTAEDMEVFGLRVPVVNREELVRYKMAFGRDVDLLDVQQLTRRN